MTLDLRDKDHDKTCWCVERGGSIEISEKVHEKLWLKNICRGFIKSFVFTSKLISEVDFCETYSTHLIMQL